MTALETLLFCALLALAFVALIVVFGCVRIAKRADEAIECGRMVRYINRQCEREALDRAQKGNQ